MLNADPTVIYGHDTLELDELDVRDWQQYMFWTPPEGAPEGRRAARAELAGLQHVHASRACRRARSPRPTVASIDAALAPGHADKYIYFLAIPDGGGAHAFAKTVKAAPDEPQEVRLHP